MGFSCKSREIFKYREISEEKSTKEHRRELQFQFDAKKM